MAAKPKKKLKLLHWKKIPNNKIPKSIWDGLQAAPGPLVARDALELVFYDQPKESTKVSGKSDSAAGGGAPQKVSLLDLRRAQTVGIMLSRFKLPLDAVARAIQRMDARALTLDDVNAVRSYLPTDDEVALLQAHKGDPSSLAPPDLHFWYLMRIPLLQRRLEAFSYLLSFDSRVRALRSSIKSIQLACQEVLSSIELRFILATVLGVGNTLNEGTFAGNARGFKVELLLRLGEVKSAEGDTDLIKYLAQRFHNEFPQPFALPASLAHSSDAAKENFLDLDREIALIMEGMDNIADLILDAEQDSVLTGVLEAFRARTADQPAALLASLDKAKVEFDKVAAMLVEERTDASPGVLFRVLHNFCDLLERCRNGILQREAEKVAKAERALKAQEKLRAQEAKASESRRAGLVARGKRRLLGAAATLAPDVLVSAGDTCIG